MANDRPFFANAEEQRAWLGDVLRHTGVWCVATFVDDRQPVSLDQTTLANLSFEFGLAPALLFLGRADLSATPVWRKAGARPTVDLIRSRAVQYNPALEREDTLLQGQLGIMRRQYYDEVGLAYTPVHEWFSSLVASFENQVHVKGATLLSRAASEPWGRSRRKVMISRGAIAWRERSGLLKQAYESVVEFTVTTSGKARRP